ncbi:hypothetical protein [Hymenobacter volaticus]|uniref:Uncharacterized protein n=1 Tax=Hymenobacter volaticus TaxID=2932254 RepID=A0ABY4GDS2_9BACT|nr:hypothetical protein [Hymenobacter volaticus]UOQ69073.1 hypothetical protein MUN86_26585 [Hymenobacter volaticus]
MRGKITLQRTNIYQDENQATRDYCRSVDHWGAGLFRPQASFDRGNADTATSSTTSPSLPGNNRTTDNTTEVPAASTPSTTTSAAGTTEETRAFSYTPEKPENGTLRG